MKLSRTTAYAVHATLRLADEKSAEPVPCSKLANDGGMPERFLLQILRGLVNHGILRSTRGVDGGYSLAKAPSQITLLDIVEAIEGPIGASHDGLELIPRSSRKQVGDALAKVTKALRSQLKSITIAQLQGGR